MRSIVFLIFALMSAPTFACLAKMLPDIENLEKYSKIYIAEVTGVILTEYEKRRVQSIREGKNQRWFSDLTLKHQVNAVLAKSFKGETAVLLKHTISGCGVVTPSAGMLGIFFIEKNSGKVTPIYENEGELYYEHIIKLGNVFR